MSSVTVVAVSLASALLASSLDSAPQSPAAVTLPVSSTAGCESLPDALIIDPRLRSLFLEMRWRAPTFRRQVARLLDQPGLVVTVGVWRLEKTVGQAARTRLTVELGRPRAADVWVRIDGVRQVVELIAHEFEHILEQLDGIDLTRWAGRSGVRRVAEGSADRPMETERARRMGRMVAREYAAAPAAIPTCGARP